MGDTGYCDEIKSEITYCLDNPHELSFTVETENMYISLLVLLEPFRYRRQTYLRAGIHADISSSFIFHIFRRRQGAVAVGPSRDR